MAAGDVVVHLFDWKWTDIASECVRVLGPAGFAAVQVSPPQEHSIVPSHDWSERYQPVSYSIARSRSGT
ncbi:MAG: ATPase, partial [Gemmatimonadota bacterium]